MPAVRLTRLTGEQLEIDAAMPSVMTAAAGRPWQRLTEPQITVVKVEEPIRKFSSADRPAEEVTQTN